MSNKAKSNIIRYWESIEYFTPQKLPDVAPRHETSPVYRVTEGAPLPWEPGHVHARKDPPQGCGWKYSVFLKPVDLAAIQSEIEARIGTAESETARDERKPGFSALFMVNVDRNGVITPDSLVCASIGWAYSTLIAQNNQSNFSLAAFQSFERDQSTMFEEAFASKRASSGTLQELGDYLTSGLVLPASILPEYRIKATPVRLNSQAIDREKAQLSKTIPNNPQESQAAHANEPPKASPAPAIDMLNSMFLGELSEIAGAVERGNVGAALRGYLGDAPRDQKDLRTPLGTSWEILRPSRFPQGRWPGKGRFPLVYSQQVAVNLALSELSTSSGIMSVNGPPGTGKTTLLKDIIASVVTQRAIKLCQFDDPLRAFGGKTTAFRSKEKTQYYYPLHPSLHGFGIAVASSNNGAVENVVEEFPVADDVDRESTQRDSIFTSLATELLGKEAWSLISATLGKKANRNKFVAGFWFDPKPATQTQPKGRPLDPEGNVEPPYEDEQPYPRARTRLQSSTLTTADWKASVKAFQAALNREKTLRDHRDKLHSGILSQLRLEKEREQQTAKRDHRNEAFLSAKKEAQNLSADLNHLRVELKIASDRMDRVKQEEPGAFWYLIHRIWKLDRIRTWQRDIANAEDAALAVSQRISAAETQNSKAKYHYDYTADELKQSQAALEGIERKIRSIKKALGAYQQAHPVAFPDMRRLNSDVAYREKSAPFADAEWEQARVAVFIAALDLHETFLQVAKQKAITNLSFAIDLIKGSVPKDIPNDAAVSAWDTFFMLVPLVSSTFASFHRQFGHLGQEGLGWLLIDEAGQAAPQQAVPALWRSRRAVVVGDPLQLTPIVSAPFSLQESLRQPWQVAAKWAPGLPSAQSLADAASRYGSYIGKLWVGAPLLVHRRCDEPMFSVCNRIAYNDDMVHGKPVSAGADGLQSEWRDVRGTEATEHWLREEGDALDELLIELRRKGVDPADIFLISPFRTVVNELYKRANGDFSKMQAGTIHTVQGKEAKVVILVLGGNPGRQGAKQWASEAPNLLNVAASRAKKHLYIIGNREEWSKYPFFSEASQALV